MGIAASAAARIGGGRFGGIRGLGRRADGWRPAAAAWMVRKNRGTSAARIVREGIAATAAAWIVRENRGAASAWIVRNPGDDTAVAANSPRGNRGGGSCDDIPKESRDVSRADSPRGNRGDAAAAALRGDRGGRGDSRRPGRRRDPFPTRLRATDAVGAFVGSCVGVAVVGVSVGVSVGVAVVGVSVGVSVGVAVVGVSVGVSVGVAVVGISVGVAVVGVSVGVAVVGVSVGVSVRQTKFTSGPVVQLLAITLHAMALSSQ